MRGHNSVPQFVALVVIRGTVGGIPPEAVPGRMYWN